MSSLLVLVMKTVLLSTVVESSEAISKARAGRSRYVA